MDINYSKNGTKRLRLSTNQKHYLNEQTKDVTFVVKGMRIPAHKVILSSCSEIFERMIYNKNDFKECKDLIDIKESTPEVFKYVLKVIYFDQFEPKDINTDHLFAIDVYKLVHKLEIRAVPGLIEEELIKMVTTDNFTAITELATTYKLIKLMDSLKEFISKNEKQFIETIEKKLRTEPIEQFERLTQILNLTQKQIIQIFVNISVDNQEIKHINRYRQLIKFDLCSVKDIIALRNTRLFEPKDLDKIIEQKYEDLEAKNNLLDTRCQKLTDELKDKTEQTTRLANEYNELNQMFVDLMAHYKEIKEIFEPFVEGVGGRVNQYVYNKSNCYFGKLPKKFSFKY